LLKDWEGGGEPPGLEAWDAGLTTAGAALTIARAEAVRRVAARAREEFAVLCGDAPEMGTLLVESPPSVEGEPVEEAFAARLCGRRADEIVRRTTLVGPHRDDLRLVVHGLTARGFASHGEAWGAALCLRLALAAAVADEAGEPPVTLDRKSTRLNSSHVAISYAVFCLKKKTTPHGSSASRSTARAPCRRPPAV